MPAPEYRADQVGSLLRPPEVLEARTSYNNAGISLEQLREIEDKAILDTLNFDLPQLVSAKTVS